MAGGVDEYHVKAVFLYNFAQFVEWAPDAFADADEPISLCVAGKNPFGSALQEAVRGRLVGTRTFVVRGVSEPKQAVRCHILFVPASEQERAGALFAELKGQSVLTVGETDRFISAGGVIRFRLKDARVRFDIDVSAALSARLRISSRLLSLADNIRQERHD
jgi:hypothetical protein